MVFILKTFRNIMKTTFFHTISIISHNISLCVKTASLTSDIVQNGFSLLPSSKKNFTDYLKKPISKNFITAPTTSDKISDLIHNLKSSKSIGPYSIPTKIMKISKEIISLPLSLLINDSISKGLFPNIC